MPEGGVNKESNQIHANAILEETIKKEMKRFRLHTEYKMTPNMKKGLVLTEKPSTTSVQQRHDEPEDAEYATLAARLSAPPKVKFAVPQTTSQEYGWETEQLLRENFNRRFHHPRVSSEITKVYGSAMIK